ncbi:hypothetical protein VPH35_122955 [Triticum aestivum]
MMSVASYLGAGSRFCRSTACRPPFPPPCVAALVNLFLIVGAQQEKREQPVQPRVRLVAARLQPTSAFVAVTVPF